MSSGTEIAGKHQKVGNWKEEWNETFICCVIHCLARNQEIIAGTGKQWKAIIRPSAGNKQDGLGEAAGLAQDNPTGDAG